MKRERIAAIYADAASFTGREITVCGWARTIRDMKNFGFVALNDGSAHGNLQVVLEREIERGGDVLLVAHNGPLSTAMSILMDMPDTAVNRLWFEQGTWSCVEIDHGVARLKYFNK